jgi:hypothetical protein
MVEIKKKYRLGPFGLRMRNNNMTVKGNYMPTNTKELRDKQIQYCEKTFSKDNNKLISNVEISRCLSRLLYPTRTKDRFILQFINAEGGELGGKFWSPRSSSRLAFDFFSALEGCSLIKNLEFEKILPGVNSGKQPDMDIYFETDTDRYYIESKYCEYVQNNKNKKGFLRNDKHEKDSNLLSPAYWRKDDETILYKGFKGQKEMARAFSDFVMAEDKKLREKYDPNGTDSDWFFAKQECTHLFGILFHCLAEQAKEGTIKKHVHFFNVVFNVDGEEVVSGFADEFFKDAKTRLSEFFANSDFEYAPVWYQDLFSCLPSHAVLFGEKETNLREYLKERYPGIDKPINHKNCFSSDSLFKVFSSCDE